MDLMTLKMGIDLAKLVKDLVPNGGGDQAIELEISDALRTIYLTPRGVTALLRKIDAGVKVTEGEVSAALIQFNDGEPRVERAAATLLFERLSRQHGISLRTIKQLDLVRDGKLSLRREIQEEINYYGRGRHKPDKERVRSLLKQIDELNAAILDVEDAVGAGKK
jgi:hypothetical protein